MRLPDILMSTSRLMYASVGVGLLVAFWYFKLFFQDVSQFKQDLKNSAKLEDMNESSLLPFHWLCDRTDLQRSNLKILIWIGLSVGSSVLAYYQLQRYFRNLFR